MRLLVHEPMNTLSSLMSDIFCPACRPMYSSAAMAARRPASSLAAAGLGTAAVTGTTSCGLVPQVTIGATVEASISTSES